MDGYVTTLITLSLLCSFLVPILKNGSKLKGYVSFSVGIICVYAVFFPFLSFLKNSSAGFLTDEMIFPDHTSSISINTEEWIISQTDIELRRNISNLVKAKFSIPVSEERIILYYDKNDSDEIIITKAKIDVSGVVIIKGLREMLEYVSDLLMCECEVVGY